MTSDVVARKRALRAELAEQLRGQLHVLERAHQTTKEAATHEEAKPENDKDTRALEQSYLARGQALRVEELRAAVVAVERASTDAFAEGAKAAMGALVTVDEDGQDATYWIAPDGGGTRVEAGAVQVVTPKSPLGRALIGKVSGDDCELTIGGRRRVLSIVEVT